MTFSILGTLESENLSLTFYAPDRSNKNVSRQDARLPARGQAKHVKKDPTVSFRPKGEIFLRSLASLGMTASVRHLGDLCVFARGMF
jgi:hypothetical protein